MFWRSMPHRLAALLVVAAVAAALGVATPTAGAAPCTIQSDAPVIVGTAESDVICGGDSANVIYGGVLDDEIYGGGGSDVLIGGHGTDLMHGQLGEDVLRGGTNRDCYIGGDGNDTASFASFTPSGSDANGNPILIGVTADLTADSFPTNPGPSCEGFVGAGVAFGEGYNEELVGIENLVGSALDDDLEAADAGSNDIRGGWGDDVIRGRSGGGGIDDGLFGEAGIDECRNAGSAVACADAPEGAHRPAGPLAFVESRGPDSGVVVLGHEGNDADVLSVSRPSGSQVQIDFDEAPSPTASCPLTASQTLTCSISTPRYVTVWGDLGNDNLSVGGTFPDEASIDVNGGPGSDVLTGGPNRDILFSGEGGTDQLYGNGNSDALISEGDPTGSGGDQLEAGNGNDQLVTDNACAGHTLWGGPDTDIIGFARQTDVGGISAGVNAQLGEGSFSRPAWAINSSGLEIGGCARSTILGGGEILEGTNQSDVLRGNDAPNTLWARQGNDDVYGNGGNDTLLGHDGDDSLWGYNGVDSLNGGDDRDDLHARDGAADSVINCGSGSDPGAERDSVDPAGISCND
jgi:Ca2+-binding RTX toxin-like protein